MFKQNELRKLKRRLRLQKLQGLKRMHVSGVPGSYAAAQELNEMARKLLKEPDWKTHLWLGWDLLWFNVAPNEIRYIQHR